MQEIVTFCDLHYERDDEKVFAEPYRIGLSGQWKRIDLCPECVKVLLGPLEGVLVERGVAVADVAPQLLVPKKRAVQYSDEALARKMEAMAAPRQCLWCHQVVAGGYAAHRQHLGAMHGLDSFEEAYGDTCPICRQKGITRLSGHIGRAHLVNLADTFEWAYYGGDAFARDVADARRDVGWSTGPAARTDGAIERVEAAREAWVKAHGQA